MTGEKLPSRLPKLVSETGSENPAGSPQDRSVERARASNLSSRCKNPAQDFAVAQIHLWLHTLSNLPHLPAKTLH